MQEIFDKIAASYYNRSKLGVCCLVVVGRSRVKRIQRWLLLSSIVAIAVIQFALNAYLTGGDFGAPDDLVSENVAYPELFGSFEGPTLSYIGPDKNLAAKEDPPKRWSDSRFRNVKASTSAAVGKRARIRMPLVVQSRPVRSSEPLSACRTVSYALVNDTYYVRVTDDTGCLTAGFARYKPDRLVAALNRHLPHAGARTQAIPF